jgi:hypothetical protein
MTSYRGVLILLMQKHLDFEVVTPRTLANFEGNTLIIPNVRVLGDEEQSMLRKYVDSGRTLVITGEDTTQLADGQNIVRFSNRPGSEYFARLQKDFNSASPDDEKQFLDSLKAAQKIRIFAAPSIATSMASVDGRPHIFFANFTGLRGGENPVQTPQDGVRVAVEGAKGHGFFLPFLGQVSPVAGVIDGSEIKFSLPPIQKGAVFWWEP